MTDAISPRQFQEADGLGDWRVVSDGGCAFYPTASLAESARLVNAIADIHGVDSHAPRIDIRRGGVTIRLLTEQSDHYGMTWRDVEIARAISDVARQLGLTADPSGIQSFLVIPGAPDRAAVMPFWR